MNVEKIVVERVTVYVGRFRVNTVVYRDIAFDPNVGSNVYHDIKTVFITHGHADHFGDACKINAKIVAPKLESNLIEDPRICRRGLFSWAMLPENLVTPHFMGEGVRVDDFAENYAISIPLPGHTYAHTGYLIENVLIAGDSIHLVECWERFGVLYYTDPDSAIESLNKIRKLDWDYIVPGHGGILNRDEGVKIVKENIKRIEKVDKTILSIIDEEGLTESEILAEAMNAFGVTSTMAALNTLKPAISGHLSSLYQRNLITVELSEKGLVFKRR